MSRRITRSQQRKQDSEREREREADAGSGSSSINGDASFSGSSVNGVESVEGAPRKGRSPTKRQRLTAVAVVVKKLPEEEKEAEANGVSEKEELKVQEEKVESKVQEERIEEKKEEQNKEEEKTENKESNGVVKGAHKKFGEEEEEPTREVVDTVVVGVGKPAQVNGGDTTNTNDADLEDEGGDDDDAPEAMSISTGRQATFAREEEIKKAREQYDPSLLSTPD